MKPAEPVMKPAEPVNDTSDPINIKKTNSSSLENYEYKLGNIIPSNEYSVSMDNNIGDVENV
jgi:hypothetical protein